MIPPTRTTQICQDLDYDLRQSVRMIVGGHGCVRLRTLGGPPWPGGAVGAVSEPPVTPAFMGAVNLAEDQGARAFLTAVRESTASVADRKRLSTIMLNLASDAARRRLETMMTTMEWKSDFIEGFVQEGLHLGAVNAKSEDILKIIDARAIDVTAEQRQHVSSCTDIAQLDQWFDSALTAQTAKDIFKS